MHAPIDALIDSESEGMDEDVYADDEIYDDVHDIYSDEDLETMVALSRVLHSDSESDDVSAPEYPVMTVPAPSVLAASSDSFVRYAPGFRALYPDPAYSYQCLLWLADASGIATASLAALVSYFMHFTSDSSDRDDDTLTERDELQTRLLEPWCGLREDQSSLGYELAQVTF